MGLICNILKLLKSNSRINMGQSPIKFRRKMHSKQDYFFYYKISYSQNKIPEFPKNIIFDTTISRLIGVEL